jgi:hypothetical protein
MPNNHASVLVAFALAMAFFNGAAKAEDNPVRSLARAELRQGRLYLDAKEYDLALAKFQGVWDMDDDYHELADLRAIAGLHVCLAYSLADRLRLAKAACQKVLEMPDAPQQVRADARSWLDVLEHPAGGKAK